MTASVPFSNKPMIVECLVVTVLVEDVNGGGGCVVCVCVSVCTAKDWLVLETKNSISFVVKPIHFWLCQYPGSEQSRTNSYTSTEGIMHLLSPSTLSSDGLLVWELVWMLGWVDCLLDCEVFDVGWEVEAFWTEAVLEFVLDLVVVALVIDSGFVGSDAGAEVAGGALVSWYDAF